MHRKARHRGDGAASGNGVPAGQLRELVARHLEDIGAVGSIAVVPYEVPGVYGLDIELAGGPSLLLEATEDWPGVRILDPDGEDVTVRQALDYITFHHVGEEPSEALEMARASKHRNPET
jgi:hypothetical protein